MGVRLGARRLRELLRWRAYLPALLEAVGEVFGGVEVYVFGSAVEGRLTASSYVDVAVVLPEVPRSGLERARLLGEVWRRMEERGVPPWYPFEIHLVTGEELERLRRGGARPVPAAQLLAG